MADSEILVQFEQTDDGWNSTIETRVSGLTRKAYGWSKYGGSNHGLVQQGRTKIWICQSCGDNQGSELPAYMFEILKDEFIRICAGCQQIKLTNHIDQLEHLINIVRNHRDPLR